MPDSTYKQILDAVEDTIEGLSLTDIADSSVVVLKHAITARKGDLPVLPGVVIAPFGAISMPKDAGTNASDDITYPVIVAHVQPSNESNTSNMERALKWHQRIAAAFRSKRLGAVTCVYTCNVDPLPVFAYPEWLRGHDIGGMVLNFVSRELRA